jgi:hypothetical protein
MLTLKRIQPKKMAFYIAVLAVLFGVTLFLIYINFLAGNEPAVTAPVVKNAVNSPAGDTGDYQEQELDFLQDAKFKALRSFGEPVSVGSGRSSNPFFSSQE